MRLSDLDRAVRDRQRFLRYIGARPEEDWLACWIWEGSKVGKPGHRYGMMGLKVNGVSTRVYAHRLAVLFTDGEVPDDKDICHKCDNPLCVRRSHLYIGDASSNTQDAWDRERRSRLLPWLTGTRHPRAKLTADKVREIRQRRAAGETLAVLAHEFGVSIGTIWDVANGRSWTHLD